MSSPEAVFRAHRRMVEKAFLQQTLRIGHLGLSKQKIKKLEKLFKKDQENFPTESARMMVEDLVNRTGHRPPPRSLTDPAMTRRKRAQRELYGILISPDGGKIPSRYAKPLSKLFALKDRDEKTVEAIEAAKRYVEACHYEDEEDMGERMAQIISTGRMPLDDVDDEDEAIEPPSDDEEGGTMYWVMTRGTTPEPEAAGERVAPEPVSDDGEK